MTGCGAWTRRATYLGGRLFDEGPDLKTVAPILLGTLVYEAVKGIALARWVQGMGAAGFLGRGIPWYLRGRNAELAASALAFVPELGVFAGLGHVLQGGEGTWGESLWRNGLTLSFLKGFGSAGRVLAERSKGGLAWARALLPPSLMFGGLYSARLVEEALDPSLRMPGATRAVDTLSAMANLGIGMYLGRTLVPFWQRGHQSLMAGNRYRVEQLRENLASVPLGRREFAGAGGAAGEAGGDWVWKAKEAEPVPERRDVQGLASLHRALKFERPASSRLWLKGYRPFVTHSKTLFTMPQMRLIIEALPATCRCLFLHVLSLPPLSNLRSLAPGDLFPEGSNLQEIHVLFFDGTIHRIRRDGEHLGLETDRVSKVSFEPAERPESEIARVRLLRPWSGGKTPRAFPAYIRHIVRRDGHSMDKLLERLRHEPHLQRYGFQNSQAEDFLPKGEGFSLPFPILAWLIETCREDIRQAIKLSNEKYFPEWNSESFGTEQYPLYLESEDVETMNHFLSNEGTAYRDTFGWLIFAVMKDPFAYYGRRELMESLELDFESLDKLLSNRMIPSLIQAKRLSRELDIPLPFLVESLKTTFAESERPSWVKEFDPEAEPENTVVAEPAAPRTSAPPSVSSRPSSSAPPLGLGDLLREARLTVGLQFPEVLARLRADAGLTAELIPYHSPRLDQNILEGWEQPHNMEIMPFPILSRLTSLYRLSIGKPIRASNQRFSKAEERHWIGWGYLIYLEGDYDLERVEAIQKGGRNPFGTRLWITRKNPESYFPIPTLSLATQIPEADLIAFERGESQPGADELHALVETLGPALNKVRG
jgi:hypothetical protein